MNGYYKNRVKVICPDLMCFPADPDTLAPLATSSYDPWAVSDPDPEPARTIGFGEWCAIRDRQQAKREQDYLKHKYGGKHASQPVD